MVKFENDSLDLIFAALSDATRRDVLDTLGQGSSTVTELAQPHGMSLPGFMKHLRVLEDAGLVTRSKEGRVVRCALSAKPMQEAAMWMSRYEKFWNDRLDALGRYLYHQEEIKAWKKAPSKTSTAATSPRSTSAGPTPSAPKKSGTRGPTRKR